MDIEQIWNREKEALTQLKGMIENPCKSWDENLDLYFWKGIQTDETGRIKGINLKDTELNSALDKWLEVFTQFKYMTSLNLSSCGLFGDVPPSINELRYIEKLDLSGNYLQNLPALELPALGNLDLSRNIFTQELPSMNCPVLYRFHANYCQFTGHLPIVIKKGNRGIYAKDHFRNYTADLFQYILIH